MRPHSSAIRSGILLLLLSASATAQLVREPYLQSITSNSVIVAWRGDNGTPMDSVVYYGTAQGALLESSTASATLRTASNFVDHAVYVGDLNPNTLYYYEVGTLTGGAQAGGTSAHFFKTAPAVGSAEPFSIWVVGDSGEANSAQNSVRNGILAFLAGESPDLFFHVGDMAYNSGTDSEFTNNHFAMYEDILARTPFWPAVGNHEASNGDSDSDAQSGPYYEAFSLPTAGEAGGEASGTEAYYSFDYANVHVVVLDSDDSSTDVGSTQLMWLAQDLENIATTQTWLVAMFHHPPYTKGTHDSDDAGDSGGRMVRVRENILPILEAAGVDLVLSGHSHIYERSYLIDAVYGYGTSPNYQTPGFGTLQGSGNILDAGDGDPAGDGAYVKPPGLRGHAGAVYVVSGHGGGEIGGPGNHPVMAFSEVDFGSCFLNIADDSLRLRSVDASGTVVDEFELLKQGCNGDDECDAGDLCNEASCNDGSCEYTPIECPMGEECNPETGSCRPEPEVVSFRQGVDGYNGVVDTFLMESDPETPKVALAAFEWDTDDPSGTSQVNAALLRFEQLFSNQSGPIPVGASIQSATLTYTVFDEGAAGDLHEIETDWGTSSTYSDFGDTPGADAADLGKFVVSMPASVATHSVDVTASLQRWSEAPTLNRGWVIVPQSSNGTEVRSSEAPTEATRPLLTVTYFPAPACTTAEACDDGDACTDDSCDRSVCVHAGATCDDEDTCTNDGCDADDGCWHTAIVGCVGAGSATGSGGTGVTPDASDATGDGAANGGTGGTGGTTGSSATAGGGTAEGGTTGGGTTGSGAGGSQGSSGSGGSGARPSSTTASDGTGGQTTAASEPNLSDGAGHPGASPADTSNSASGGTKGGCGCRVGPSDSIPFTPGLLLLLGVGIQARRRTARQRWAATRA